MISIIAPVYNVEKYLRRCIDSVLNQTDSDFELILVDDGSPDSSGEICDEYSRRDNRITVIHQENGGLANARNAGLEVSSGDYIVFLDSDDWIEPTYIERLSEFTVSFPDLVVFSYWIDFSTLGTQQDVLLPNLVDIPVEKTITELDLAGAFNVVWNKMYSKKALNAQPKTRFIPHSEPGEDIVFNSAYFKKLKKATLTSTQILHYMRQGEDTLANKYCPDLFDRNKTFIKAKKELYEYHNMTSHETKKSFAETFLSYVFCCIPNMYRKVSTIEKKERLRFYHEILEWNELKKQMKNYAGNDKLFIKFISLYKKNSPRKLERYYSAVCWARNNLGGIYNLIRKKFLLKSK